MRSYDPLPFTQGEVIAGAKDGNHIDVRIHAGYPRKPYARIDVIDRQTRFRKKGMPFLWGAKAEMIGEDVVRVHREGIAKFAVPGDLASLSTGQESGALHAISIDQCERMTFRNVTVHSAPGMGILEADGEGGSSFIGCKIVPGLSHHLAKGRRPCGSGAFPGGDGETPQGRKLVAVEGQPEVHRRYL